MKRHAVTAMVIATAAMFVASLTLAARDRFTSKCQPAPATLKGEMT